MSIVHIDYSKLHGSPEKRILFLNGIINLVDMDRESITYHELELFGRDRDCFAKLLGKEFEQFFTSEDRIERLESVDGYVIIGANLLIQDLNKIQTELIDKTDILYLIEEMKKENQIDGNDLKLLNKVLTDACSLILLPKVFWLWLFKYIDTPLIPHSESGLEIYQTYLKSLNEDEIKQFFNLDKLCKEIELLPKRKRVGELKDKDITQIKNFIFKIIKNMEKNYSSPKYWFNIYHEVNKIINKIIIEHISPTPNQKIFLILKGDIKINPRNPIISRYDNKIVLFNDAEPLSRKLKDGDIILGTIKKELKYSKAIIVNPEKVLGEDEVRSLLERSIDAAPSRNRILERLEHLRGGRG